MQHKQTALREIVLKLNGELPVIISWRRKTSEYSSSRSLTRLGVLWALAECEKHVIWVVMPSRDFIQLGCCPLPAVAFFSLLFSHVSLLWNVEGGYKGIGGIGGGMISVAEACLSFVNCPGLFSFFLFTSSCIGAFARNSPLLRESLFSALCFLPLIRALVSADAFTCLLKLLFRCHL